MFAGRVDANDIKEQLETLHEHCENVKRVWGLLA